eukprot:408392-Pyramimonas_sp.AAC.1
MVKRANFETANATHISKRKRRNKGEVVTFDPEAHKEWITGFRKRKQQRRKAADKALVDKETRKRQQDKKEKREELKAAYEKVMGNKALGERSDNDEEVAEEKDEFATIRPFEGTTEYGNGTQVVVQAIGAQSSEGESDSEEDEEEDVPQKPKEVGGFEKKNSQPKPDEKKLLKSLQLRKSKGNMKNGRNMDRKGKTQGKRQRGKISLKGKFS